MESALKTQEEKMKSLEDLANKMIRERHPESKTWVSPSYSVGRRRIEERTPCKFTNSDILHSSCGVFSGFKSEWILWKRNSTPPKRSSSIARTDSQELRLSRNSKEMQTRWRYFLKCLSEINFLINFWCSTTQYDNYNKDNESTKDSKCRQKLFYCIIKEKFCLWK